MNNKLELAYHQKLKLCFLYWAKSNPLYILVVINLVLITACCYFCFDFHVLYALIPEIAVIIFLANDFKKTYEVFENIIVNPGVVIRLNPFLIAVSANLSKTNAYYPVIKVVSCDSFKGAHVGMKIAAVTFRETRTGVRFSFWDDFDPIAVNKITNDPRINSELLSSFTRRRWELINQNLKQVSKPYKVGLYRITGSISDWK